jgi:outer membrane lipoprotein-sorting protein
MIFEHNPQMGSFDDIKPGQNIMVPSDYAKQIVVYIDQQKFVPLGVKTYDDSGLYEEYSYLNIQINPFFESSVFDSKNPGYGF